MSRTYKSGEAVPSSVLIQRLHEIAIVISKGDYHELTMRIPAEVDRDADLVVSEAGIRLKRLGEENAKLREWLRVLTDEDYEDDVAQMVAYGDTANAARAYLQETAERGEGEA